MPSGKIQKQDTNIISIGYDNSPFFPLINNEISKIHWGKWKLNLFEKKYLS